MQVFISLSDDGHDDAIDLNLILGPFYIESLLLSGDYFLCIMLISGSFSNKGDGF